jgi:hypothetical protein
MTELPDPITRPDTIVGAVDWNITDILITILRHLCEVIA